MKFEPLLGVRYAHDYVRVAHAIAEKRFPELQTIRSLILSDLWFILYFVMGIESANHPFVVRMCQLVESGPERDTLDVWARYHYKSSTITQAETLQYHLRHPGQCTGILAYSRPAAKKFLRGIKRLCEESSALKACFPDVLYENPERDSPKWSEDDGIVFRRKNAGRGESTVEAWGLTEGMPTGRHFERLVFDDLETEDIRESPDMLEKVWMNFQMASVNLLTGRDTDIVRVIGTYYSHIGPNIRIRDMKYSDGRPVYRLRLVPGSDDGTASGSPVLMDPASWEKAKLSVHFNSQQLCDPTPQGNQKLDGMMLRDIEPEFIPRNLYKVMVIDPAGDDKDGKGDAWAVLVVGIEPRADAETGLSNVYITNALISPLPEKDAPKEAVRLYLAGGYIQRVGIEKVGQSTAEVHVANALEQRGIRISEDAGTLEILRPAGRKKASRIEKALAWPLSNGKVYISTSVPKAYRDRIRLEMDKFPCWHDDGIDALAYVYDMVSDMRFDGTEWNFSPLDEDEEKFESETVGKSTVTGY